MLHRLPNAACQVAKHIQGEATVRPSWTASRNMAWAVLNMIPTKLFLGILCLPDNLQLCLCAVRSAQHPSTNVSP